jgi:hypothetical protein
MAFMVKTDPNRMHFSVSGVASCDVFGLAMRRREY